MTFGKRRPKPTRAQLRPAHPIAPRQGQFARRRDRLTRVGLVGLAVLLTALLVHGAGPPFTYRLGQRPDRELRVNVDSGFSRRDPIKTNKLREVEADKVPLAMVNDPSRIRDLAERLVDLVDAVATAPRLEAVQENVRSSWGLTPEAFVEIKAAVDSPARRDDLERQIAAAFGPVARDGVLHPDALPPSEEASRMLAVRSVDEPESAAHPVPREQTVRERVSKPDGAVAQAFIQTFARPAVGQALFALVAEKLAGSPTLSYDEATTTARREDARRKVKDEFERYPSGTVLVGRGQEIGEPHLSLLQIEHATAVAGLPVEARVRRAGSVVVLVASLFALVGFYINRHEPEIAVDPTRIAALCGLVVAAMGLVRLLAMQPWDAELVPIAITAMILAIAYNPHFALMVTFALCLLTSLALGTGIDHFVVMMGGTATGILTLNEVRTRTKLIKVGATLALGYFVLSWATGLYQSQSLSLVARDSLWRAGWGLMAGFFLGGSLPFVETAFGIVTGISLLELGDITHPLLQELVRRAPGTHNHSVTVATIAEAATERIGGNSLLVRIGAYFHDIGKMLKPHYFVENQAGAANRHANLAPAMSTLIIIGHVKDGLDLGRQHHLPERILDLIEQHHGTTLVEYFYREATRRNDGNPDGATIQESSFRYPGPKPQTKEAGILMVSDAVESASRTLSEPTPARIEGLVRELIDKRLDDGQFDECGLTLREIGEIRESLIKSLIGIYHGRVKYPEQRTA